MMNLTYHTGAPWEKPVAYSRARRVGNAVFVAGTTAMADGVPLFPGDYFRQAEAVFRIIAEVLEAVGARPADVVRTRMYICDMNRWEEVGRAHGAFFAGIDPVATMVEVSALIHPDLVVEIEVDAILQDPLPAGRP